MRIVIETTKWEGPTPNHVYVCDDNLNNMIGYVPVGSKVLQRFKKPIAFDRRGRTFVDLEEGVPRPDPNVRTVEGSKGQVYTLSKNNGAWSCSCPGYTYRGACRHVAELQQVDTH